MKRWQRPRPCHCGGYWFPHRKGGGACEDNKQHALKFLVARYGGTAEQYMDAMIDFSLTTKGKPDKVCPF